MQLNRTAVRNRVVDIGSDVIRNIEGLIAKGSMVGNPPVFDNSAFPFAQRIEANWEKIRAELDEVLKNPDEVPPFQTISPDQRRLTEDDRWKTYFFYAFGYRAERNCRRCPETVRLLEQIPGLTSAFFSILEPGKHLPDHRGAFKGILRYHLGLLIPDPANQCGIRIHDQVCHWSEGRSLIFDDTYRHEAWNHTDRRRVVLFVDFKRPLRFPARSLNWLILTAIKHSPFVTDAVANYEAWEAKLDDVSVTRT